NELEIIRLRVFVTSRPETPIRLGFNDISREAHQSYVLHSISAAIVDQDISIFFQHKLSRVKRHHNLSTPWPDELAIQQLVARADSLFIYAATSCRFIEDDSDPKDLLYLILDGDITAKSLTKYLDNMYMMILTHAIIENQDQSRQEMELERS